MSPITSTYVSSKHCVRSEGVQNLPHFENMPNTSLETRWKKIHIYRSELCDMPRASVTRIGSGFLNFKFVVMVFSFPTISWQQQEYFSSWIPITLPLFGQLLGKWVTILKPEPLTHPSRGLIPHTETIPSQAQQQTPVSSKPNAFLLARLSHVWTSTPQVSALVLPFTASPRPPQLTCPLCFNKGLSAQH